MRNLRSVAQFCADTPFTENQVRWWIFNAAANGLEAASAIVRVGRRVYIDLDGFERWVATQNVQKAVA